MVVTSLYFIELHVYHTLNVKDLSNNILKCSGTLNDYIVWVEPVHVRSVIRKALNLLNEMYLAINTGYYDNEYVVKYINRYNNVVDELVEMTTFMEED